MGPMLLIFLLVLHPLATSQNDEQRKQVTLMRTALPALRGHLPHWPGTLGKSETLTESVWRDMAMKQDFLYAPLMGVIFKITIFIEHRWSTARFFLGKHVEASLSHPADRVRGLSWCRPLWGTEKFFFFDTFVRRKSPTNHHSFLFFGLYIFAIFCECFWDIS